MIESVRLSTLGFSLNEEIFSFEIFTDSKGKINCAIGNLVPHGYDMYEYLSILDFESGKLKKSISTVWDGKWDGDPLIDNPSLKCLLSRKSGFLFSVQYEEDYILVEDYKKYEKKLGFLLKIDVCFSLIDEFEIAFRHNMDKKEIVFFDLKEKKTTGYWKCEDVIIQNIQSSNINIPLLFVHGDRISYNTETTIILNSKTREIIHEFSFKQNFNDFISGDVFFDFSGKYTFGCCGGIVGGVKGISLIRILSDEKNENSIEVSEIKNLEEDFFFCFYGFGDEYFLGTYFTEQGEYVQSRSPEKGVLQNYVENAMFSDLIVKNKGRDIFVLFGIQDEGDENKVISNVLHLVNTLVVEKVEVDSDEIGRIEYIHKTILEDEEVHILKLFSLSWEFDLFCMKILFLM